MAIWQSWCFGQVNFIIQELTFFQIARLLAKADTLVLFVPWDEIWDKYPYVHVLLFVAMHVSKKIYLLSVNYYLYITVRKKSDKFSVS